MKTIFGSCKQNTIFKHFFFMIIFKLLLNYLKKYIKKIVKEKINFF